MDLDNPLLVRSMRDKWSRLLYRYLTRSKGYVRASKLWPEFQRMLGYLKEMADIMRNKTIKVSGRGLKVAKSAIFFKKRSPVGLTVVRTNLHCTKN